MAEEDDGDEREEVVQHREARNEREARRGVQGRAHCVALYRRECGVEDGAAGGRADAGPELEERFQRVERDEGGRDGRERRANPRSSLLRARVRRDVQASACAVSNEQVVCACALACAKVPADAAHGTKQFYRVAQACKYSPGRVRERRVVLALDGGRARLAGHGLADLEAALWNKAELDGLADCIHAEQACAYERERGFA